MVQALAERSCELQILRQQMMGKELGKNQRANAKLFQEDGEQPIQVGVASWISVSSACYLMAPERAEHSKSGWRRGMCQKGGGKK